MTPDQFVTDAIRTESQIPHININAQAFQQLQGALIHLGTILDQIKKNVFYQKPFRHTDIKTACGMAAAGSIALEKGHWQTWFDPATLDQHVDRVPVNPRLFHAIVGIATEAVELLQALNINSPSLDEINLREEFGDLMWYIAIGVDETGGHLDEVMDRVIAKLRARFPDKFTSHDAINRDLEQERKILEGKA